MQQPYLNQTNDYLCKVHYHDASSQLTSYKKFSVTKKLLIKETDICVQYLER